MTFIETHCHLDYLKDRPLEETLSLAKTAMIEKIITISVEPDNFEIVRKIANDHEEVFCTQGVHPHDAKKLQPEHLKIIEDQAKNFKKCVAVGEIGLDYHYDNSPREIQREAFRAQLDIAARLDLPVVIHSRDADEDMMMILKEFTPMLKSRGVIHSFTSGKELAEYALSEGFFLGFNGIITFKKADDVRDIVHLTPIEQMLFETDSPFLTPVPHRGKENAPFYLPHVAEKICELKETPKEKLYPLVKTNSENLFKRLNF